MTQATTPATQSTGEVRTENASRYLQQLCKHFSHKVPVTADEKQGRIDFPFGTCRIETADNILRFWMDAPDAPQLEKLMDVVQRHLLRFAFREELHITWNR